MTVVRRDIVLFPCPSLEAVTVDCSRQNSLAARRYLWLLAAGLRFRWVDCYLQGVKGLLYRCTGFRHTHEDVVDLLYRVGHAVGFTLFFG